eukprot:Hpha_TRINITY_DN15687_c5_g13::TRINITY_DN15687_c5_g13_i1::g.99155::m.99155
MPPKRKGAAQKKAVTAKEKAVTQRGKKAEKAPVDITTPEGGRKRGRPPKQGKKEKARDQWSCEACTFLNDASLSLCDMCGTPVPIPAKEASPANTPMPPPKKRRTAEKEEEKDHEKTAAAVKEESPPKEESPLTGAQKRGREEDCPGDGECDGKRRREESKEGEALQRHNSGADWARAEQEARRLRSQIQVCIVAPEQLDRGRCEQEEEAERIEILAFFKGQAQTIQRQQETKARPLRLLWYRLMEELNALKEGEGQQWRDFPRPYPSDTDGSPLAVPDAMELHANRRSPSRSPSPRRSA